MKRRYPKCMKHFLDYLGANIPLSIIEGREIDNEVLLSVTPKLIVEYFNFRAYGIEYPSADARPTMNRSSTLHFYKKAISNYMPNSNSQWDDVLNRGNPTKSKQVNDMIKAVVKHEVRHEGVTSKARRAFDYKEYLQLCKIMKRKAVDRSAASALKWCRLSALMNMQWQLMARMDDMINLKFETVTTNLCFPFAINCQMRWSKNITEERDAPDQVLFGSMEEIICPLLNLGLFIECSDHCGELLNRDGYLFGGDKARSGIRRLFDSLINDSEFVSLLRGLVGNHSVRKGAATYAMRSGLSRDHINRRGRWRVRKQVVDAYIDVNLPYPDALAAHKLCGPKGSCKYKTHPEVNVSNTFVLEKVAPSCFRLLGEPVVLAVGYALLWAVFEDKSHSDNDLRLPSRLTDRVVSSFEEEYGSIEGFNVANPVKRVPFVPHGVGDQVSIIEIGLDNNNIDEASGAGTVLATDGLLSGAAAAAPLLAHSITVQRQIEETKAELLQQLFELRTINQKQYRIICGNIKRIALQPVVRPSAFLPGANQGRNQNQESKEEEDDELIVKLESLMQRRRLAKLYRSPKTLYDLWQEYQFGLNGEKPAKEFTVEERGRNKSMFCRRKVFWDTVRQLVLAGHTSDVAIDKVYEAYGRGTSVATILLKMIRDRKEGGHPSLRV